MGAYENYLAHHGVKGQKWGVRRYQNADGTLTAEGRARYLKEMKYGENNEKTGYTLSKQAMKDFTDKNGKLTKEAYDYMQKNPNDDFSKALKDAQMGAYYQMGWADSYNKAADAFNSKLEKINDKWGDTDFDYDDAANLKYTMEVANAWKEAYGDVLIKDYGEHPYLGKEWINNAFGYDQFDSEVEHLKKKVG